MNTTIVTVLSSLVIGFIAGTVASIVVVEAKTDNIHQKITNCMLAVNNLKTITEDMKETDTETIKALRQFFTTYVNDRTALWAKHNELFNKYDKLVGAEPEEETEEPAATDADAEPTSEETETDAEEVQADE